MSLMKLTSAFKWALPIWFVLMIVTAAVMFLTNYVEDAGVGEALKRYSVVAGFSLPAIAYLIKRTADDFSLLRRSVGEDREGDR